MGQRTSNNKLFDNILGNFLNQYDIIMLCETWTSDQDSFMLEGFEFYNFPRLKKHCNAKRNSGGLGAFIRNSIKEDVSFVKGFEDVIVWFKLRKNRFNFPNDIYLGNTYVVPEGSNYLNYDVFHLIKKDIAKFPADAQVLLCGDYNARTGTAPDVNFNILHGNDNGLSTLVPDFALCFTENTKHIPSRYSMEKAHINDHGNHLLELCKSTGLVIFNGRLGADKGTGEYTRVDTTGCSVIDYFVGSPALFDIVSIFCVKPKFPESDHRPLECFLSSSSISKGHDMNHPSFDKWLPHVKYKWSSAELHTLTETMCDMQSQGHRSAVIDTLVNKLSTNDVADAFDNYIHRAIDRNFATRITNASVGSQKGPKWYDRELRLKRSAAVKVGENNLQGMGNGDLVTLCREYRSTKQRKQREYKRKCLESIEYAFKYDKHSMWEVLKNIDRDNRIIVEPSDVEFYEYFKSMSSANDLEYFNDN